MEIVAAKRMENLFFSCHQKLSKNMVDEKQNHVSRASILTALAWKIIQMELLPYLRLLQGIILYNRDRK